MYLIYWIWCLEYWHPLIPCSSVSILLVKYCIALQSMIYKYTFPHHVWRKPCIGKESNEGCCMLYIFSDARCIISLVGEVSASRSKLIPSLGLKPIHLHTSKYIFVLLQTVSYFIFLQNELHKISFPYFNKANLDSSQTDG